MSYVNMDHAGWLQRSIEIEQRRNPTKREREKQAQGQGWFAAPSQLNHFHRRAVNIIGIVGGGIYNAPISWTSAHWSNRHVIVPWWGGGFATWDFSKLTTLVCLCHEARIRAEIGALHVRPGHLSVGLHERRHDRSISDIHPNLDEAIASFREWFKPNHMIAYSPQPDEHVFAWRMHKHALYRAELEAKRVQGVAA